LTQNYSNYLSALGGESARPKVDSLLGNLQTKIFHQNGDTATNTWAAEAIGRKLQYRQSSSTTYAHQGGSKTESEQQVVDLEMQPREFTTLWKGGPQHHCLVQAVVFQSGRKWSNGRTWKHILFPRT
jgi:hypothetical protein